MAPRGGEASPRRGGAMADAGSVSALRSHDLEARTYPAYITYILLYITGLFIHYYR